MLIYWYVLNAYKFYESSSGLLTYHCFTVEFSDEASMRAFISHYPDFLRFEVTVLEFKLTERGSRFINAFSWCYAEGYPLSSGGVERGVTSLTEAVGKGGNLL